MTELSYTFKFFEIFMQNTEKHSVEYGETLCRIRRNTLQNTEEHPVEYGETPCRIRRNTLWNTQEHPVELTRNTLLRCSRIQPFILTLSSFYTFPLSFNILLNLSYLYNNLQKVAQWLSNSLAMFLANCLLNNFNTF